jgi:hypothetical protein
MRICDLPDQRRQATIRKMKSLAALMVIASGVLFSGCEITPTPSGNPSTPSEIVGSVADCEDGFLFLRLANGQTVDLLMPDSDWLVVPQSVLKSNGRKCRVQVKRYWGTNAVGQPQFYTEITRFEWL